MRRFVLILIFLCFLKVNCPNRATHLHTTGGRRGTRLPNQRGRAAIEQQDVQPDHPPWGGGGS